MQRVDHKVGLGSKAECYTFQTQICVHKSSYATRLTVSTPLLPRVRTLFAACQRLIPVLFNDLHHFGLALELERATSIRQTTRRTMLPNERSTTYIYLEALQRSCFFFTDKMPNKLRQMKGQIQMGISRVKHHAARHSHYWSYDHYSRATVSLIIGASSNVALKVTVSVLTMILFGQVGNKHINQITVLSFVLLSSQDPWLNSTHESRIKGAWISVLIDP